MIDDDRSKPQPGELVVEFLRGHDRFRLELRDHGEPYGVELQVCQNEEFLRGRRFDRRMDPTRPPRELALAWAEEERQLLEEGGD